MRYILLLVVSYQLSNHIDLSAEWLLFYGVLRLLMYCIIYIKGGYYSRYYLGNISIIQVYDMYNITLLSGWPLYIGD